MSCSFWNMRRNLRKKKAMEEKEAKVVVNIAKAQAEVKAEEAKKVAEKETPTETPEKKPTKKAEIDK